MIGFTDQHKAKIDENHFPAHNAAQFIDKVIEKTDDLKRLITIPVQLEIALDLS